MADTLRRIFPGSKEVAVQGEKVMIEPFKFSKLSQVTLLISSFFDKITMLPVELFTTNAMSNPATIFYLTDIIKSGGENVMELVALAANKDRDWVDTIDTDEGLELLLAIFEVNQDFFEKRLKPLIQSLSAKLRGLGMFEEEKQDKKDTQSGPKSLLD